MSNKGARFRRCDLGDGQIVRRKVHTYDGIEGMFGHYTDTCSGCDGAGCEECGYNGKRRHHFWIPFEFRDLEAKEVADGERCPLCGWWVGHKHESVRDEAMRLHRTSEQCKPNADLRRDIMRRIAKREELLAQFPEPSDD